MKPKTKASRIKPPAIVLYVSEEFRDKFYSEAEKYNMTVSSFANLCLTLGHKDFTKKFTDKKTSSNKLFA